ncbi:MAG TPA: hypothetical protein VH394_06245, partial [Thermoanaerobaculia bacterium]|nr:hypothetical protein [Thermoanaerobaculia bacterium]
MKAVACSIVVLALALAAQAAIPYKVKPGEKVDERKGMAIRQKVAAAAAGPVTCTLTFSPATVTNGQVTNYSVSYGGGCVSGQIVESIWLHWPSTVADFGELTVRKKMLNVSSGCLAASFEAVVAPSALGIKGAFKPTA